MKNHNFIILFSLLIFFISCNDDSPVNNGTDKTVIEKNISPSSSQQSLESTEGIRVIIPGGTLNSSLGIKLVKLANPPKLSSTTIILGTNIYKLSLSGDFNLNHLMEFRIKYDKSKIKAGFTQLTGVKAMVYLDNTWSETEYQIDVTNEEIVISLNPIEGKVSKYSDKLLKEAEVVFGDGYTTTDTGQNDDFLGLMHKCFNISIDFSGYHTGLNNGEWSSIHVPAYFDLGSTTFVDSLKWNGNSFSVNYTEYGTITTITGTVDSKNKTISLTAKTDQSKLNETLVVISCELQLQNVPYEYDSMMFGHTFSLDGGGQDVKNLIKSITYTKSIKDKNKPDTIISEEEYSGTDFSKNASVEIEMMHK